MWRHVNVINFLSFTKLALLVLLTPDVNHVTTFNHKRCFQDSRMKIITRNGHDHIQFCSNFNCIFFFQKKLETQQFVKLKPTHVI